MRIIESIEEGNMYHIYNRGINDTDIFKEKRNYYFFLDKYKAYCSDILETYAYALLKNHFHLMVKVKENIIVTRKDGKGEIKLNASKQLSHFFNSYAQAYNKTYNRHGKLFEEPFRRKLIEKETYFTAMINYIHCNPQKHGFVKDFRDWEFTSWHSIIDNEPAFISKEKVIRWFGTMENFQKNHLLNTHSNDIPNLIIE